MDEKSIHPWKSVPELFQWWAKSTYRAVWESIQGTLGRRDGEEGGESKGGGELHDDGDCG